MVIWPPRASSSPFSVEGARNYYFIAQCLAQKQEIAQFQGLFHSLSLTKPFYLFYDNCLMVIAIGSDHAGFELKEEIKAYLKELGIPYNDLGPQNSSSVDYPDYGEKVAEMVSKGTVKRGILICGTGIGMSIVANKFPGVRAALCNEPLCATLSRQHNDANILVMGGRLIGKVMARVILKTWLNTGFEGGRHESRLKKIAVIEGKNKRDVAPNA